MTALGRKGAILTLHCRVWVAMWVQSTSKKVSFCLIILAGVAADTLRQPIVPTAPRASPGSDLALRRCQTVRFPPIAEETTTNPSGRGAACEFGLRHLIRFAAPPLRQTPGASQKALNVIGKAVCATAHRSRACDVTMNIKRIELGMIPALGIGVDVRMFAAEGSTGLASRQKRPQPSCV
jgi:hypothetical protein